MKSLVKLAITTIITTGAVVGIKEIAEAISIKREEKLRKQLKKAEIARQAVELFYDEAKAKEDKIRKKLDKYNNN